MSEPSDARAPLSVLIPVKNEAANVRDCISGVSFAEEIVVVDSASTDGTQAIAEEAGARVVQFVWNGNFPRKKNWALENIPWQNEWVLIVDADERITPELQKQIRNAIRRNDVGRLLPESPVLVPRRLDQPLRLFSQLEFAAVSASARPIRTDRNQQERSVWG